MAKINNTLPSITNESTSIHNELNGLNEGDYIHLTVEEKERLDNLNSFIDAPVDGNTYGRKDNTWEEINNTIPGTPNIQEVLTEGNIAEDIDVTFTNTTDDNQVLIDSARVLVRDELGDNLIQIEKDNILAKNNVGGITKLIFENTTSDVELIVPSEDGTLATKNYADNKISTTITNGVTDKAPNENAVFDALALKEDKSDWIDYSTTSTIIGFSSFINKVIKYKPKYKEALFYVNISGVSNSGLLNFTIPFNAIATSIFPCKITNNSLDQSAIGILYTTAGSDVVQVKINGAFGNFTSSNNKGFALTFSLETN